MSRLQTAGLSAVLLALALQCGLAVADNYDDANRLFKPKYELVISEYRKLSDEQRKVADQVLIIKDGMPQLDITPPSTRAPKK